MSLSQQLLDQVSHLDLTSSRKSKLDPFQYEIMILRQVNLTYKQIKVWLKKEKQLDVSISQLAHCINERWKDNNDVAIKTESNSLISSINSYQSK